MAWVTDDLAVSGSLHPRHFPHLSSMGVTAVVDMRQEGKDDPDLLARHGIDFLHLPVRNLYPPTQEQLRRGARWVLDHLGDGGKALVHCRDGIGRSVSLAACVLMTRGCDADSAVALMRSVRWGVALRRRQRDALREFQRSLGGLPGP
jgi:protein-tyrosine phosphatase